MHRCEQAQRKPGLSAQTRAWEQISDSVSRHRQIARKYFSLARA